MTAKNRKISGDFHPAPAPMPGPAAFAVLNQHVLRTLPVSPARRENLLRALVVCAARADAIPRPAGSLPVAAPPRPRRWGLHSTLTAGRP